jgi:autotransporter-associated beta strand protein
MHRSSAYGIPYMRHRHFTPPWVMFCTVILTSLMVCQQRSEAQSIFYWDTNGVAAPGPTSAVAGNNTITGGAGTWSESHFNFTTSATDSSGVNHNAWTNAAVGSTGKNSIVFGGTGGTITLGTAGANTLGTAAAFGVNNLTFNSTSYSLSNSGTLRFINNGSTSGSITVGSGLTATVNSVITDSSIGGLVAGTADGNISANLRINGGGTLGLYGNNSAYTGAITIEAGTLDINSANALGTTAGGTIIKYNGSFTSGGRLNISAASNPTIAETITLEGEDGVGFSLGLRVYGAGTVDLTNAVQLVGPDTSSTLRLGTASGAATILNFTGGLARTGTSATNTGGLIFEAAGGTTINVNGAIDNNAGTIQFTGTGLNTLNAVSTDVGQLQIDFDGTVRLGISNAVPSTSPLRIGRNTGSTGTGDPSARGTLNMNGFNLSVASLDGGNGATAATTANRIITNSSASASVLTIGSAAANTNFDGVIENGSGGGTVSILKTGASTQTFSGTVANTYTGSTTVNGGTLILAKSTGVAAIAGSLTIGDGTGIDVVRLDASNQIADSSLVTFNGSGANAGILRLNNRNEAVGGISSTGGAGIIENESGSAGTSTLTSNVASGSQTFSGILRNGDGVGTDGTLAFTKIGNGTQVLTGANTYSGSTTVTGGTLVIGSGGTTGTGAVTIQNTSTILGTGTIQGSSFTAQSGSSVHVGNTTAVNDYGTLTFTPPSGSGNFDFQSGSTINLGLNATTPSASDLLTFNGLSAGSLTFNGNMIIGPSTMSPTLGQIFNLIDWVNLASAPTFAGHYSINLLRDGSLDGGSGFDLPNISSSGFLWDITSFTTNGQITVVVPEPSRALLLVIGLSAMMMRRRSF